MIYNRLQTTHRLEMYIKPGGRNVENRTIDNVMTGYGTSGPSEVKILGGKNIRMDFDDLLVWDDVLDEDAINILLNRSE